MNAVLQHLHFHRSLHDTDHEVLQRYVEMATTDVASYKDPFDRAVALAFHVILDGQMDPWKVDLAAFARAYMARVGEAGVDLVTAGRLVAMAWAVLAAQAKALYERSKPPEPQELGWDDLPDSFVADDAVWSATEQILRSPPLKPIVLHESDRPVSLLELVDALEEARRESETRLLLDEARKLERAKTKERLKNAGSRIHREDLEAEIHEIADHLAALETETIPMAACHDGTRGSFVQALVALLFLSRAGSVRLEQENFPVGPILVHILDRERLRRGISAADIPKVGAEAAPEPEKPKARKGRAKAAGEAAPADEPAAEAQPEATP